MGDLRRIYNELAMRERDWDPWRDPDHRDRLETVVRWAVEVLPPGGRALDAGCGHGEVAAAIARRRADVEVVGVDIADVWVEEARRRHRDVPNVRFERADVRDLPYDDDEFHTVICAEVLEHLPGDGWVRALRELDRVCRPEGRIIITIPDDRNPDGTYHVRRLTPDDVSERAPRPIVREAEIRLENPRFPRVWVLMLGPGEG